MRKIEPKRHPTWLKATERRQELLILSEFTLWTSHWDPTAGASRRCGGDRCLLCTMGLQRIQRWVVLGLDQRGDEKLFELRERHREVMQRVLDEAGNASGVRVSITKRGAHANAPVDVTLVGVDKVFGRDITNLVSCFGLPPKVVGQTSEVEPWIEADSINVTDSMSTNTPSQEVPRST